MEQLSITPRETKIALQTDKNNVVEVNITLPFINSAPQKQTAKRINRFYDFLAHTLVRYAKDSLYKPAVRRYRECAEKDEPFNPSSLTITYKVAYEDAESLSIIVDRYEYIGGANGVTVRTADNWNVKSGAPILRLFPRSERKKIIRDCTEIAVAQQNAGIHYYFEHLPQNMQKYFSDDQSYLTPLGLVIFYQEVTISPHDEGIPVFVLANSHGT